jgi:hypothetical protein
MRTFLITITHIFMYLVDKKKDDAVHHTVRSDKLAEQ